MTHHSSPRCSSKRQSDFDHADGRVGWMLRTWFTINSVVAGVLALIWLVLRSGPKPSRFVYPCQQAAFSAASLAFAAPLISTLVAARRGLVQGMRTPAAVGTARAAPSGHPAPSLAVL